MTDPDVKRRCGERLVAERKEAIEWPSFEQDLLFELLVERCLLMLAEADEQFPQGPTVWRAS